MKMYRVKVCLEAEYYDIEAENEEEAFAIASDYAVGGGDWYSEVEELCEIEEAEEEE